MLHTLAPISAASGDCPSTAPRSSVPVARAILSVPGGLRASLARAQARALASAGAVSRPALGRSSPAPYPGRSGRLLRACHPATRHGRGRTDRRTGRLPAAPPAPGGWRRGRWRSWSRSASVSRSLRLYLAAAAFGPVEPASGSSGVGSVCSFSIVTSWVVVALSGPDSKPPHKSFVGRFPLCVWLCAGSHDHPNP
jgi:hypothetical protein